MKIVEKIRDNTYEVEEVESGELFRYKKRIFIKTDEEGDDGWTCVDLATGETSAFDNDEEVEIISGTLVIE